MKITGEDTSDKTRITETETTEEISTAPASSVLWFQDLRVDQEREHCIEFTQENSIENSIQDCLRYKPQTTGLCTITLAYSKWPYVCLKATIYIVYSITSFLSESSTIFHHGTWSCDSVTVTCDIPLIPNPSFKNRINWEKQKIKEK